MLNLDVPVLALLLILLLGMLMRLEKSKLVSKPSTLNRFSKSVTRFHIFSPIHAKVQTNKQTNLRSPAGHTRPWITGIGVCSNTIESATQTNRKLRWFDSWVFDVRRRCTSAEFPSTDRYHPL